MNWSTRIGVSLLASVFVYVIVGGMVLSALGKTG